MSHRSPISMADLGMEMIDSDQIDSDFYDMLKSVAGISIPEGTPDEYLKSALMAALKQKQLSESDRDGGTVTNPPKNSQKHEVPVVMSVNQTPATTTPPTATPGPGDEVIPPDGTVSMS